MYRPKERIIVNDSFYHSSSIKKKKNPLSRSQISFPFSSPFFTIFSRYFIHLFYSKRDTNLIESNSIRHFVRNEKEIILKKEAEGLPLYAISGNGEL